MVNKTQSEKQAKKAAKGALLAEKTKIDQTHLASVGLKNLTKMSISEVRNKYADQKDKDFAKLYNMFWDAAPYYFIILVGYLWPMTSWHFFFKFKVYPWNDFTLAW